MTSIRSGLTLPVIALPLVLALLLTAGLADFRQAQNLSNFGGQIATLLMCALGQLFVTLAAGIDLSVGAVVSLASCIVATQPDPLLAVLLVLAMGVTVGLVNGLGVAIGGVHPLVMTLCSATFLQGLNYLVLPIPGGRVDPLLGDLVAGELAGLPLPLYWCAAALALTAWIVNRTRFGLHLVAVGSHARSAHLNGVPVAAVTIGAYVLCSLFAAVAGIYLTARVSAGDPVLGAGFTLESVAAVALGGVQLTGGVGSAAGVALGVLSLGLLTNGLNLFGISPFLRVVLTGALLLVAVSLQRRRTVGL